MLQPIKSGSPLARHGLPCHIFIMREKELRLALICYGGVSLAVYMHGITREIWHLVRASRAYLENRPSGGGSEDSYRELLELIEAGETRPAAIIAAPVGFVGATERVIGEVLVARVGVPLY